MEKYLLEHMTWQEARDAFQRTQVAAIPIGSTEQHGPHMPLGTDFLVAKVLARMIGERTDVVVTPTLPIGFADYHTDFPGSLSLERGTLTKVLIEVCEDLVKYGITHILFVNGHGGNIPSIVQAGMHLRKKGVLTACASWWQMVGALNKDWQAIGHGDYVETSAMLAINAALVKLDIAKMPESKPLTEEISLDTPFEARFRDGIVLVNLRVADMSETGDMIEYGLSPGADYSVPPSAATKERGEAMLEGLTDYLVAFVEEFKKASLPPLEDLLARSQGKK
jgi:creatinine amidohydrolase